MNRRQFLKNMIWLGTGLALVPELLSQNAAEAAWNTGGQGISRDPLLGLQIRETNLSFTSLENRQTTDAIVIHHIGNTNRDVSAEEVHQWHKNNGWAGIGYHFLIRKDGTIERGRPMDMVGAHCYQNNWHTVGINIVGEFMNNEPLPAQLDSAVSLLAALCKYYGIAPSRQTIKGHREFNSTDCPGDNLYYKLSRLVNQTQARF